MYVPRFNAMVEPEVHDLVAAVGSAELVTVAAGGYPAASLLPVIWDDDRLVFHMARANQHWRSIREGAAALAVVTGPQAYVSPAWYPSKGEDGRVVPTWNYTAVHFTGRVHVHDDPEWVRDAVTRLTVLHEQDRERPWSVEDAPDRYLDKQLKAIVGIELAVESVQGKAKLSQNRSAEDQAGVVEGLRSEGGRREHSVADQMQSRDLSAPAERASPPTPRRPRDTGPPGSSAEAASGVEVVDRVGVVGLDDVALDLHRRGQLP